MVSMLPDIHYEIPKIPLHIMRIGIRGIRLPPIRTEHGIVEPAFELYVDVPHNMRGAHLSRSYEALIEAYHKHSGLDICMYTTSYLLRYHEYSDIAITVMKGSWIPKGSHHELGRLYRMLLSYTARRGLGFTSKELGVRLLGLIACPCAYEVLSSLGEIPGTHMQRIIGEVKVNTRPQAGIDHADLANALCGSMSVPASKVMKRGEEAELVKRAIETRKFAEDVVREITKRLAALSCEKLPDDSIVSVKVISLESVHTYNVIAEIKRRAGYLRGRLWAGS